MKYRQGYKRNSNVPIEYFKNEIQAIKDWDNADYNLIKSSIGLYDESILSEKEYLYAKQVLNNGETLQGCTFIDMLNFLKNNEQDALGILKMLQEKFEREYQDIQARWGMQSIFSHGGQGIVTDVWEHKNGVKTGEIFTHSPGNSSKVILFSATIHMIRLIHSFALLRGWAIGEVLLHNRSSKIWFAWEVEDSGHPLLNLDDLSTP